MRNSPTMQALARKRAIREAASSPYGAEAQGTAYELLLGQLAAHRRQLKDIQSIERKIAAKADFLPTYWAWISATLKGGQGAQDQVFTTCLIWCMDCSQFEQALSMARY